MGVFEDSVELEVEVSRVEDLSAKDWNDNQMEIATIKTELYHKMKAGKDIAVLVVYSGEAKIFQKPAWFNKIGVLCGDGQYLHLEKMI